MSEDSDLQRRIEEAKVRLAQAQASLKTLQNERTSTQNALKEESEKEKELCHSLDELDRAIPKLTDEAKTSSRRAEELKKKFTEEFGTLKEKLNDLKHSRVQILTSIESISGPMSLALQDRFAEQVMAQCLEEEEEEELRVGLWRTP